VKQALANSDPSTHGPGTASRRIFRKIQISHVYPDEKGLNEEGAYQTIRSQAMSRRVSMEEVAIAIINAKDLLHSHRNGVLLFSTRRDARAVRRATEGATGEAPVWLL
jgi:ANTAR domain